MKLINYLNKKPLFYKKIDYNNVKIAFDIVKKYINFPKTIHIVGTNAKGSTGRFLAYYLYRYGFDTIHYSSPHIKEFNERIWINNKNVTNKMLDKAHLFLKTILPKKLLKRLSYFEYTTLISFYLSNNRDFFILEAGLGGEFDATNVLKSDFSIVTPIDFDHQEFLGNSIKSIATTKINSVLNAMILANQPHKQAKIVAKKIARKSDIKIISQKELLSYCEIKRIDKFIRKNGFALFLEQNLELAASAVKFLSLEFDLKYLRGIKLEGRMQKISSNIFLDVGHNKLAAKAILENFKEKRINLIYNCAKDKDAKAVLEILKPIINYIYPLKIDNSRINSTSYIEDIAKEIGINVKNDLKLNDKEVFLVFGSFFVVEYFLKDFFER